MSIRILTGKELVCWEAAGGFIVVEDWLPIDRSVELFTMVQKDV